MPNLKKFVDASGLAFYDSKLKNWVLKNAGQPGDWNESDESSKSYIANKPFGLTVDNVLIRGIRPTAMAEGSEIENMPVLVEGDTYTVVFDGQTYEDLTVTTKEFLIEQYGSSMTINVLGNEALCVRRSLSSYGVYTPEDIHNADDNECDFFIAEMTFMGDTQYIFGKFITENFDSTFSWTLKDNITKEDICSSDGQYLYTGDILAAMLLGGQEAYYGSYYLDSEEMTSLPEITSGVKLNVSIDGGEEEVFEFQGEDISGFPLYVAGDNSGNGHLYFIYSPAGGVLQIQMGLEEGSPLFVAIYDFSEVNPDTGDTEINKYSADLSINLSSIKKLDKEFYDVDWSDVESKPFYRDYENESDNLQYLHVDNRYRTWVRADQTDPVDITGWLKTSNDAYGYATRTDTTTSGYNHLYTFYGDTTIQRINGDSGFISTIKKSINQGYPYEGGNNDWVIPFYCGNNSLRITPTSDPDNEYDGGRNYQDTAAAGIIRITFNDSSRTYSSINKCYMEDVWLCGTEGNHSFSLGYYTFPQYGGWGTYNVYQSFTATCPAPVEDGTLTVFRVRSDYYFPSEFDESIPYKVTFRGQEYTLYPYHLDNVRINGVESDTWDNVHPYKPYDCLIHSKVSNQQRYSGWVFGDVGYLERTFGINIYDVSKGQHVSTTNKAIDFCIFRTDTDLKGVDNQSYSEECFLIADVPTGTKDVIGVYAPTYHKIDKLYLPIEGIDDEEIRSLINNN